MVPKTQMVRQLEKGLRVSEAVSCRLEAVAGGDLLEGPGIDR